MNAYKIMGRGWVTLAEETADTIAFPIKETSISEND
jgi:hypothetical protein